MWNLELEDFSTNFSTTTSLIQCIIIRKETIAILFEQYLFLISTVGLQALSDNPRRKLTKSVLTDSVVVFPRANSAGSSRLLANWLFSSCKTLLSSKLFFSCNWFLLFLLVYFNEKLPILTHLTLRHRLPVIIACFEFVSILVRGTC